MLGLEHEETVGIDKGEEVGRTTLYLKVCDTCGDILLPDVLGFDKGGIILYGPEIIGLTVFTVPGDKRLLLILGKLAVLDRDALVAGFLHIMGAASGAVGSTAGVHQHLQLFGVFHLIQQIPAVVQIVIQHHILIVLCDLRIQLVDILYLLAGGAVICKFRVFLDSMQTIYLMTPSI